MKQPSKNETRKILFCRSAQAVERGKKKYFSVNNVSNYINTVALQYIVVHFLLSHSYVDISIAFFFFLINLSFPAAK